MLSSKCICVYVADGLVPQIMLLMGKQFEGTAQIRIVIRVQVIIWYYRATVDQIRLQVIPLAMVRVLKFGPRKMLS